MMRESDAAFIRECLRRYYYERFGVIEIPGDIHKREFGYRKVDSGMTRHIKLKDKGELRLLLMQETPLDVYVSNARYLFPSLPMNEKMWQNADMIFDIDAKDLNLECRPSHAASVCGDCGREAAGHRCGSCGSGRVGSASLPCDTCMKKSKLEVKKLLDVLKEDLGVDQGIRVYFSGNEGFHIHVAGSKFDELKSRERSDLADYLMFKGIMPDRLGMKKSRTDRAALPDASEKGWRGRFAREIFGQKKPGRAKKTNEIISGGYAAFERLISDMSGTIGVRIDPGVTMDVHRIFRMPGTVNGKSGMTKVACRDIASFDPYKEAVLMPDDTSLIRAACPVSFRLNGRKFGPYHNEYAEVPVYAAVYLVCKGLAHVVIPE